MGILIGLENISHEWPGKPVLKDQTIAINSSDRIGIVGRNGDGKSTLLEIIASNVIPDSGDVVKRNNIHIGMLGQKDNLDEEKSVEWAVVGDTPEYIWASNPTTRSIIDELLVGIEWNSKVKSLSGGQRRRVDLARLLVGTWDVLLLDEPTNHLDVEAITWLANHLKERWAEDEGALLVVTHDRWFLDEVCSGMWEVHDCVIDPFEGGYSAYIQQRAERARQAQVLEEKRQNILRKELAWLATGPKARTSKPKFRIDEAKALIADEPPVRNPLELKQMATSRLGKQVFELKDVSLSFDDKVILDGIDWLIGPGDRYGILGANGTGKSTFLNVMAKEIDVDSGIVKIGKSVKLGRLSQRLDVLEDRRDWRVSELLATCKRNYMIDGKEYTPTQLLERLGFNKSDKDSFISDLSGGQARRLAIMYVLLQEPNVLLLDEPGNDLDTDMLAVLEDLLDGWPGTLILVTHDRYLMERVTDDQFALIDGKLQHLPGGVDQYLKIAQRQGISSTSKTKKLVETTLPTDSNQPNGLSNKERHELRKRFDAISRKLDKISDEPKKLKSEMRKVDVSDYEKLASLQDEIDAIEAEIEEYEEEWIELSDILGLE